MSAVTWYRVYPLLATFWYILTKSHVQLFKLHHYTKIKQPWEGAVQTHIIFHSVLGFFLNYLFCCKKFINSAVIFSDRYSTVLQASNVFFFIQYSIITLLQCRNRPILDKNHHLLHVLSTSLYTPWCVIQIEPMADKIAWNE